MRAYKKFHEELATKGLKPASDWLYNVFLPGKWSDRKEHGGTLLLCIIWEEYSNRRAPIMICSYICYGVKKALIQTYYYMGIGIDERSTETIIFDRGVRKYVRVNAIITYHQVLRY